tara:strand:- start:567 stop:1379 length:813 start_codon:yes stop_codon:yes gene_type:complete
MSIFLNKIEKSFSDEFERKGFLLKNIEDIDSLEKIRKIFIQSIKRNIKINKKPKTDEELLNFIHEDIRINKLNDLRLKIINEVNQNKDLRKLYYKVAKKYLDILVGNELAMQLRINLSIQLPNDKSSLLPLHSDVWSGDSPYEIVVWLPLVNCYRTKAMYILPPNKYKKLINTFLDKKSSSSDKIYKKIKSDLNWIKIKYGQILLFNQCLPHGNVVNKESETRWSLNCRFKGIFTPYKDKKIGEFFEPITLRKISDYGMKYKLPKIDEKG